MDKISTYKILESQQVRFLMYDFYLGFANDEFLDVNGRDGEKAYTLGRLRHEERLMNLEGPNNAVESTS